MLGFSLLFLFAGAITMVAERGQGADAGVLAVGALIVGGLSALWLWKNPSWWVAPRNHYLYLIGGSVLGVVLFSLIPFLNGTGPWLVLGAAIVGYGWFERFRLLITAGAAVFFAGFLAMLIHADVWGSALHLVTTGVLAFTANQLYVLRNGRRREAQDSDPGFIGSFEEFDPAEALKPELWSRPGDQRSGR
ncbi:hypothetical protein ART_3244 [Arthrobacter sp. PAMC 25486]|uniref:hypothetical protein n=1 Tax=Arthrobacter sp. PAMC 25486 TaxID=1494608 RepID=UPI000535C373|nr:hypothetical protein [Arthrobacter sp. PAMC 25486]AIY02843.1 hypothetical protein ART_3244 [Arthrobacter sp. PAMC 25486]